MKQQTFYVVIADGREPGHEVISRTLFYKKNALKLAKAWASCGDDVSIVECR